MLKRLTLMIAAAAMTSALLPAAATATPDRDRMQVSQSYAPAARQAPPRIAPYGSSFAAPSFTGGDIISFPQMAATAVSRSQAKAIALRANRGAEYLDIKLSGGKVWLVRIMMSGERFDVAVDAQSGRYLGRA